MKFLTETEKSFYLENGFILLKNVFDPNELEEVSQEYDRLFQVKVHILKVNILSNEWKLQFLSNMQPECFSYQPKFPRAIIGSFSIIVSLDLHKKMNSFEMSSSFNLFFRIKSRMKQIWILYGEVTGRETFCQKMRFPIKFYYIVTQSIHLYNLFYVIQFNLFPSEKSC